MEKNTLEGGFVKHRMLFVIGRNTIKDGSNGTSPINSNPLKKFILLFSILGPMTITQSFSRKWKKKQNKIHPFIGTELPSSEVWKEDQSSLLSSPPTPSNTTRKKKYKMNTCLREQKNHAFLALRRKELS